MAFDNHSNLVTSQIAAAPADAVNGQVFGVLPGDGSLFVPDQPVTLWPQNEVPTLDNAEIGYVTAVAGDQLTVLRGQEDTVRRTVAVGWNIAATLTARNIEMIEEAVDNKVDVVVGKGLSTNDYSADDQAKLAGIAAAASQNAPDAFLRDRTTHTGSQAVSTITGLQAALDAKVSKAGDRICGSDGAHLNLPRPAH